ncbi:MAG: hypothetical protein ALECFALPRED_010560, partial [Alectoria fallacina]
ITVILSVLLHISFAMRASTIFTFASLFLIGSHSLPQPENLKLSRTIEDREAKIGPGSPFASHSGGAEWWKDHQSGGGPPASNDTKIKKRQEHHESSETVKLIHNRRPSSIPSEFFEHKHDGSGSSSSGNPSTNETKIKERQGPPPGDKSGPPEGLTFKEFVKHIKHKGGSPAHGTHVPLSTGTSTTTDDSTDSSSSSTDTNSTKVRMMKFRD